VARERVLAGGAEEMVVGEVDTINPMPLAPRWRARSTATYGELAA
jgi:hypothetical protein